MDSPSQKLVILLAFSLALVFSASSASAESKLVNEVCSRTNDYPSCIAALQLDLRATKATTLLSLSEIALQAAATDTARSRKDVDRMLADPNTRSSWKPALQTCKANFDKVAAEFSAASRKLMMDRLSANYDVLMASQAINACLAFLRSHKQNVPPLVTRRAHAKSFVSIDLVVTE
ncbi:uncharacterized protein LOC115741863 [Rhodamnia argentea]|uniref:Uncharacterized protein LOC115741863 n=1 Tax=Rhodamnia argentea TaxID=178133 RepID=A0A8B8PAD8_9MYRT|nr:uncharacterized protein LOC115741863 [Rhodamnia argentea]